MNELHKKFGESIVIMAIAHLFNVGKSTMETADAEAMIKEVAESSGKKDIITAEVQEQIIRCAKEMAEIDITEILRYIKVDYAMPGIFVQEGKVIRFMTNVTEEHLLDVVVPSETPDEVIRQAVDYVNDAVEEYGEKHDDYYAFSMRTAICDSMNKAGVRPRSVEVYSQVYI